MTDGQLAYIRRVLHGKVAVESFTTEAGEERAVLALETLSAGGLPTPAQLAVLEAIVRREGRPVWKVVNDSFVNPGPSWTQVEVARSRIENAIRAVGRIDLAGHPSQAIGGTAFIVGPNLMMTNRHVAELFASGSGMEVEFRSGRSSSVDFKQEAGSEESIRLQVRSVRMLHPYWDCALLRVEGLDGQRPQLSLMGSMPESLANRDVLVIGYPSFSSDPSQNPALQIQTFEGVFQKKRLQPGTVMGHPFQVESYGRIVEALAHDCSTLGGNSGSAVLDLETGSVLALHFSGAYLFANYAVPGWELALDARLADEGVRFENRKAVSKVPPVWLEDRKPTPLPQASAPTVTSPDWFGGDWYERVTDAEMARALVRSPDLVRALIDETLGRTVPALGQQTKTNPELPEIILLPTHLGCHLDNETRVWLTSHKHARLAQLLRADDLQASQHVRLLYEPAVRAWKARGFRVHVFVYDWRQRLNDLALQFSRYVERLSSRRRRFAIVGHGLGGLVACAWALRENMWRDTVITAVLAGVPLHGCFFPVEAFAGTLPLFRNLTLVDPSNDLDELRAMAASFPAWTAMLPDPLMFAEAEDLYRRSTWADGIAPSQIDLEESRNWKAELPESPLLRRAVAIASNAHATHGDHGDGVVAARSATMGGIRTYATDADHFEMFTTPEVAQAVGDLLSGQRPMLSGLKMPPVDAPADVVIGEPEVPDEWKSQRLSARALRWLLGYTARIV